MTQPTIHFNGDKKVCVNIVDDGDRIKVLIAHNITKDNIALSFTKESCIDAMIDQLMLARKALTEIHTRNNLPSGLICNRCKKVPHIDKELGNICGEFKNGNGGGIYCTGVIVNNYEH
jgi:hypothetical protein